MSKQGRPAVRSTLYMCCLSMIRWDENMRALYHRFRGKAMNHYQAMGVLMHKLLRIVGGILKTKTPYDPQIDNANRRRAQRSRKATAASQKSTPTGKNRFNTPAHGIRAEQVAPISRREHQKRKQVHSPSSRREERAGFTPA